MANKMALGFVIGGAVDSTVGKAFKDVESKIKHLDTVGSKARVLQNTIGDTIRLREEWRKAHMAGAEGADKLLTKLESNLDLLKKQGIEVGRLNKAYAAMGRVAAGAELKALGHRQLEEGRSGLKSSIGQAGALTAAVAIPTKVSADFRAIIRDISIKAGIANTTQEQDMSRTIITTSQDTGMARNQVAEVVNALVGAGMDLTKALEYAPKAAKFVVGQGADGTETAKMINALGQNAKITDPAMMQKALEAIAFQGQAGSFESADMARWFPELLANMGNLKIYGMDAVTQLGSMLQVQMKTAGGADEAANNLKNWMGKIGSGDTVDAYKKAGIDYQASMTTGLQNGTSTLESSFALAQKYIAATDPKKAKEMAEATAKISKETDPEKAKGMIIALEEALRTGDLFADMQVKAALTAYMQNKDLYNQLKKDSADATGILDKNLAERRQTSSQKWAEMAQSMDDGMRSIGDALRPVTDAVADGITSVARRLTALSDETPRLVTGIGTAVAGLMVLKTAVSAFKMGKGLMNLGRGTLMGNPNIPQKVIVTNLPAVGGGLDGGLDGDGKSEKSGKAGTRGGRGAKVLSGMKGPAVLAVADAGFKAWDTYQNAETQDEKAEGYGQAAGGLAGTLAGAAAGAAIGTAVPIIGNIVGGLIGGYLGYMGGDALGGSLSKSMFGTDDSQKTLPAAGPLMMANAGQNLPPVMGNIARSFAPAASGPRSPGVPVSPKPSAGQSLLPERDADGAALGDVTRSLTVPTASNVPALLAPVPVATKSEPPKIEQRVEIQAPLSITVQGDVKDPAQLARELRPFIEQQMRDATQQLQNRKLYDEPHV
ncbi:MULTISPECIES: phage tail tape measure protein [Pseudomonas]|uniref:phage tail tape measure protein n=1 Tax=Pseudomonas TaxID=286 RepID=UPI000B35DC36|nr:MULTISPECIES: phage tail tape measure protein [Pseudomonas]PMY56157.1 phage tail tape measure protein [Pseudomonas sp. FW305-53]PMY89024.1 phage tail tape measure protein [Pseudomonas sp. FW303-C2]PMY92205.1 phage tail tape measure protein [Pseudomonas sp. FW305-62]PNA46278.1 phage tail tape measure protein [Pseudomonas sp. FW306-2-2C-A10BC]PNB21626.1 phage tail tape measure protein [Pseudomonas sp. FW305-67]